MREEKTQGHRPQPDPVNVPNGPILSALGMRTGQEKTQGHRPQPDPVNVPNGPILSALDMRIANTIALVDAQQRISDERHRPERLRRLRGIADLLDDRDF